MSAITTPWLDKLSTWWTCLNQVHSGSEDAAQAAVATLIERYRPAVMRYLLAAVRDPNVADDLFQEFAVRLTRGDFRSVRPEKGRFRDFLKTALSRLARDHQRRSHRGDGACLPLDHVPECPTAGTDEDREFLAVWRQELFEATWAELKRTEEQPGRPLYMILRLRTENDAITSEELATQLSVPGQPPVTPGRARKLLMQARSRFTDLLVTEVAASLDPATRDSVAEELANLELLSHCQDALDRWDGK